MFRDNIPLLPVLSISLAFAEEKIELYGGSHDQKGEPDVKRQKDLVARWWRSLRFI